MKTRKLFTFAVILAICVFGLLFLGCPPDGADEKNENKTTTPGSGDNTGYNMSGIYEFSKNGGNCTWRFAANGNYQCSGYGISGTKNGTWKSKGNDVTISYSSSAGSTTISGEEVFTVQTNGNQITLTIKDDSIQLSNILVQFGLAAKSITLTKTGDVHDGDPNTPFTSLEDLGMYLSDKPSNWWYTPYKVKVNITDSDIANLRSMLIRYVDLDLSGSTITTIPRYTFDDCFLLTGIIIPDSVTSIEERAFCCRNLTSVIIGNSVTSIGEGAFGGCKDLKNVTIPNSVISIGVCAFNGCEALENVTIGKNVNSIGQLAFNYNNPTINVDVDNNTYSSEDGILYNKDKTTLIVYPAKKNGAFKIPNSVKSIEDRAFYNCTSLTSVTIPDSVTSIGEEAFDSCESLENVTIPNGITSIEGYTFYKCTSFTGIIIPNSVINIKYGAFYGCTGLTNVTIPDSVTSIEDGAFYGCTKLISVRFERTGITISLRGINSYNYSSSFIDSDNLKSLNTAYTSGGIGTYTRPDTSSTTWTKISS
jgi:hypothetical protein